MHVMGAAQAILDVVLEAGGGEKVRLIRLKVGKRHSIVRDSLEFSFRLAASDTAAAEATITVEEVPARLRCRRCGAEGEADLPLWNCRTCGASDVQVLSGDELLVEGLELDSGRVIRRRE